uniref:Uncharacterized protein n=1 Tax=Rhizophora mucronata TaxID=61149 RepID=A0A2P2PRW7_RHIMU
MKILSKFKWHKLVISESKE